MAKGCIEELSSSSHFNITEPKTGGVFNEKGTVGINPKIIIQEYLPDHR